eukprot:CAMPEP_0114618374 /NCGR_PEP_ID=MMETSP0168-20121206/7670_1 /TAXON_ID=95228 ORGANISM="Vannella sp., Strain DIVA3 517/6/12" /NCGR_SAMPLE_ID=MMETSP0168 /ASSEMBLY_ACC=CAM_ASM_000044 /LENGTH=148 /DNA_ID=CAMNT_0001829519 /DNA_START=44 /DNA_END=490 /DNA_ORIENTATION=+
MSEEAASGSSKLNDLSLTNNNLTEVPEVVSKLTCLRTLRLSKNQITILPDHCLSITLEVLDLSYNKLEGLPASIGELVNLRDLYLSSNDIKFLPNSMREMKSLQMIDLQQNPNLPASLQVVRRGEAETKALLEQIANEFSGRLTKGAA